MNNTDVEITPENIIQAKSEKTYCNGCKYQDDGKDNRLKICKRIIAQKAACKENVRYWVCSIANSRNECKFYKAGVKKRKWWHFLTKRIL